MFEQDNKSDSPSYCGPALAALVGCALLSAPASGQQQGRDPWALCEPLPSLSWTPDAGLEAADEELINIFADGADLSRAGATRLYGQVVLLYRGMQLHADEITYWQADQRLAAAGRVYYRRGDIEVSGRAADVDVDGHSGRIEDTRYQLPALHAHGSAEKIDLAGATKLELSNATFTTCNVEDPAWLLRTGSLSIDRETRQGRARNVTFLAGDVPVFYVPYIQFPVTDERMSGLLYPDFGLSSQSGYEFSLPYYWNIAPQLDATITPYGMSKRGLMMEGQLRYLTQTSTGQFNGAYLHFDDVYGDTRGSYSWLHQGQAVPGWSANVAIDGVSDDTYLSDFGGSLNSASSTHLEQRADLNYNAGAIEVRARAQQFQTLGSDPAYRQLPALSLRTHLQEHSLRPHLSLNAEAVRFDEDELVPTGNRYDLTAGVGLPWRGAAGFVVPKIAVRYTGYELENVASSQDTQPARTLPIASADAGLVFERDTAIGDTALLQTLEPRLFYLYVPYRAQDDLPVFDTSTLDFTFDQLFRTNRFSGPDRVGDANQVTAALTSRLLRHSDGQDLARFQIGQIYYFDDREVTLTPTLPSATSRESSLVAGLGLRLLYGWGLNAVVQWDPSSDVTELSSTRLQYRNGLTFGFGHRYRYQELEAVESALLWPLHPQWQLFGRWQYSLRLDQTQEAMFGVQYEGCCWGVRVSAREYLNGTAGDTNTSVNFEVVLKGLSEFSDRRGLGTLVEDAVFYD